MLPGRYIGLSPKRRPSRQVPSSLLEPIELDASDLDKPELATALGKANIEKLKEDLPLINELVEPFSEELYLEGLQTPVFFGSALYNFGVKEVLDMITDHAPGPQN